MPAHARPAHDLTKNLASPGALFQKHRSALVNYILGRVNCRATAADIPQEAYLRLAESGIYLSRVGLTLSVHRARHQKTELGKTRLTTQINVNNILDKRYYLSSNGTTQILPGDPLSVSGSVRLEY